MEVDKDKHKIEIIRDLKNSQEQCRVCLKYYPSGWDLFRDGKDVIRKLMAFANVQMEEGDGLPTIICLNCRQLVDVTYNFKCQVEHSDIKLRNALLSKDATLSLTHSINRVISDAMSEEFTQKQISCNVEDRGQLLNDINAKIHEYSIHSNQHLVSASLVNANNIITFDITGEDKNAITSEPIENNFIYREAEKLNIHESLQQVNPSRINETISETQGHLDINFQEEYVKLEAQSRLEFSVDKIEKATSESADIADNVPDVSDNIPDNYDSDNEETPLISRTQRQKCPKCIKTFPTKVALEKHVIMHKPKTKLRYVCYLCEKQFSHVGKLKSHYDEAHERKKDDSSVDEMIFNETENEKRIEREEGHSSEKKALKFTCKVCSKQFTYQKSFISHAKIHPEYDAEEINNELQPSKDAEAASKSKEVAESEDEELLTEGLQCTKCGKLFATKRNLKRHLLTHTGLKYNCPLCGKEFSRVDKLKEHEQSKHPKEIFGELSEDGFDEGTNDKANDSLENRKKEKYNRPHQCNLCPKAFAQPQSLANHMERHKRVKDTQKRFLCEVCSKCFAQSGSLVAHMRTHTGVKPYVCNVCTKAFTKSTYLQLHLRTHSGEKPYICQYCSRAFARANTLARHITMHTGEAKYHCQICMKSFRRLTSLNEHTYTHTGQRPYACKICAKRYNNAGSLYAHTKKCKSQQQSGIASTFSVCTESTENSIQNNIPSQVSQPISTSHIFTQKKLLEATAAQSPPTPQFMVANVHNQKPTITTNIIQPFTIEDPNLYAMNAKQFKNPYYAIYPNM